MSRPLSGDMATAIVQPVVRPCLFYEGYWAGGVVRMWTQLGPVDWDGKTWTGAGELLAFSKVEETDEIRAAGISMSLSGVSSANIAKALAEPRRNLPGTLWFGLLTDAGVVIEEPRVLFRGRMDIVAIEDGVEFSTIRVNYENELITLEKPREIRYTDEEQQRLFPDDLGCQFAPSLQDIELHWGRRT